MNKKKNKSRGFLYHLLSWVWLRVSSIKYWPNRVRNYINRLGWRLVLDLTVRTSKNSLKIIKSLEKIIDFQKLITARAIEWLMLEGFVFLRYSLNDKIVAFQFVNPEFLNLEGDIKIGPAGGRNLRIIKLEQNTREKPLKLDVFLTEKLEKFYNIEVVDE